mgnify:CR=1 FL=1
MKFANKMFYAILFTAIIAATIMLGVVYTVVRNSIYRDFSAYYQALGKNIANSFQQMEKLNDIINKNAAYILKEKIQAKNLLSEAEMRKLAKELGVQVFYIINKKGELIRSSDVPNDSQPNSIFNFCSKYRNLVFGKLDHVVTPILPNWLNIPAKYIMIPSANRNYIIESEVRLQYIEEILHKAVQNDKNIKAIGLYSPNDYALGYIDAKGRFYMGKRVPLDQNFVAKSNSKEFKFIIPATIKECCECTYKKVQVKKGENYFYTLKIDVSLKFIQTRIAILRWQLFGLFLLIVLIAFFVSRMLAEKLVSKLETMDIAVNKIAESGDLDLQLTTSPSDDELSILADALEKMLQKIKEDQDKLIDSEKSKSIATIASQVVHDIQSPLAALNIVIRDIHTIPEQKRRIIQHAIQRINDIANNLLTHYRKVKQQMEEVIDDSTISPELIYCLSNEVISEKRAEYQEVKLSLKLEAEPSVYSVFSAVNLVNFKRVLSNLINNSIDAINDVGEIRIQLCTIQQYIHISIIDNGCGMDAATLEKVLKEKVSIGKIGGSGIGLASARELITAWQGRLTIHSIQDEGTTVNISLPQVTSPNWFAQVINIPLNTCNVVVLEDDSSIHDIWIERFATLTQAFTIHNFTQSDELIAWMATHEKQATLFLIDYELLSGEQTGLDLIDSLKIRKHCYLVTSHHENQKIRERCSLRGIKIVPKYYAAYIPMKLRGKHKIVLLDDEEMVRLTWTNYADTVGERLSAFATAEEFFAGLADYPKDTVIYIDSELGEGVRGENIAKALYDKGYREIYLATGHRAERFSGLYWIEGIVGKTPPF